MGHKHHASYWSKYILPDEKPLHTFGVSRLYVFMFWGVPFIFFVAGAMYLLFFVSNILALLSLIAAAVMLMVIMYQLYFIHYCITDKRVMSRQGLLWKRMVVADLQSITDVTVFEPFFERLIARSATIGINTAGHHDTELHFMHVATPMDLRSDMYKHLQEQKQDRVLIENGATEG